MLRRNARLRREYLYRKSLEGKEREEYERKRKIRQALDGAGALFNRSKHAKLSRHRLKLISRRGKAVAY